MQRARADNFGFNLVGFQIVFYPVNECAVQKAWLGLVGCIHEDGKIGFVQRVGAHPQSVKAEDTMEYGTGAFLLAGKEIYEILNE